MRSLIRCAPVLPLLAAALIFVPPRALSQAKRALTRVPGVVIYHFPASEGQYIGSPGIAVLPNGDYIAKMDYFGPKSAEKVRAVTRLFRSPDKGETWEYLTDVEGMYWCSVFVHRGDLYLMGTYNQTGDAIIRKSTDGGHTWSDPADENTGRLIEGRYHTAPVPVIYHNGRIWRAMEDSEGEGGWGSHFHAFMMSAPEDADLLKRSNWTVSTRIGRDAAWLDGEFRGWLEGNAVVTPDGGIVDVLRVACDKGGLAARIAISEDGKTATFDPAKDFFEFPGGAKKFTVRWDTRSKRYWSLVNYVPPKFDRNKASATRNTLALAASPDLTHWEVRTILLHHPDTEKHGFQYVDWLFEGDDMIAACRTAYDDGLGGAHNYHDANFLTFHRIKNFRKLKIRDSVVNPKLLGMK